MLQAKSGVYRIPEETERFPEHRHEVLKWNGWGYNDSLFSMNEDGGFTILSLVGQYLVIFSAVLMSPLGCVNAHESLSGMVEFRGKRYELDGCELPLLREWMEVTRKMNFDNPSTAQVLLACSQQHHPL